MGPKAVIASASQGIFLGFYFCPFPFHTAVGRGDYWGGFYDLLFAEGQRNEWPERFRSGLISCVWTASWENPHPKKCRAQAATDGLFVRAPIHAPRWKRGYCPLGGRGGWSDKGRVEVAPCWNKSTWLSWGGRAWSSWATHGGTTSLLPCPLGFSLLFSWNNCCGGTSVMIVFC